MAGVAATVVVVAAAAAGVAAAGGAAGKGCGQYGGREDGSMAGASGSRAWVTGGGCM